MRQRGSATVAALGIIILCVAFAASYYGLYYSATVTLVRSIKELEARSIALTAIDAIMTALQSSGEDGIDSKADLTSLPSFEGIDYAVEDISSGLNLNLLPAEVFESPAMTILAGGNSGFMALRGLREQTGPTMDFEASFGSVVDAAAIDRWCTPYSYANVNTDDPEAVARFYALVSGDDNVEGVIKAKMDKLRKARLRLDHAGYTLGFNLPADSYPLIGVESQINPNHAERTVLETILTTPSYALDHPAAICDALCAAADAGTLDLEKIMSVIGPDPDPRLSAWFGTRTWFWRVSLAVQGYEYVAVLRRTGPTTGGDVLLLVSFIRERDHDE